MPLLFTNPKGRFSPKTIPMKYHALLVVFEIAAKFDLSSAANYRRRFMVKCVNALDTTAQAGPRSAVGNVSGYRCLSDCISRGREFDPGPAPYFRGD